MNIQIDHYLDTLVAAYEALEQPKYRLAKLSILHTNTRTGKGGPN